MRQSYQAGEIILVDLGEVHEVRGHEQARTRPCVVVKGFTPFELAIVLPITSSSSISYYTIVPLSRGAGDLTMDSYVHCHQIRTISFNRIVKSIGTLSRLDYLKIMAVLSDTIGVL